VTSIKLKTSVPRLQIRARGLSNNVVLVVFGIKAPEAGTFEPSNEPLGELTTNQPVLEVALPIAGTEFRHAALKFAMTFLSRKDVATTEIQLRRSQDEPEPPSFERPVQLSVELKRPSETAPLYVETSVVLEEET
jgi:hypothetical protein